MSLQFRMKTAFLEEEEKKSMRVQIARRVLELHEGEKFII